jgi:CDP-diacylglycerol--glycerol-3-phosphate 3-phosphatidyltransferase
LVVRSVGFWAIYFACGISDMLDGFLARKLNAATHFGAVLDSVADLCFVVCCSCKLIPVLEFPLWMWIWCGVIAIIKLINQVFALVLFKRCIFLHSVANKATGLLLFVGIPLALFMESIVPVVIIAIIATFAAVQEGHFIRTKNSN